MAAIPNASKTGLGPINVAKTALTASDTLTYNANTGQELYMYNTTGTPVVVTIDGNAGTTVPVPGAGATTLSVASGLAVTVPANDFTLVKLDTISAYLKGVVGVTGGTGVSAIILN